MGTLGHRAKQTKQVFYMATSTSSLTSAAAGCLSPSKQDKRPCLPEHSEGPVVNFRAPSGKKNPKNVVSAPLRSAPRHTAIPGVARGFQLAQLAGRTPGGEPSLYILYTHSTTQVLDRTVVTAGGTPTPLAPSLAPAPPSGELRSLSPKPSLVVLEKSPREETVWLVNESALAVPSLLRGDAPAAGAPAADALPRADAPLSPSSLRASIHRTDRLRSTADW